MSPIADTPRFADEVRTSARLAAPLAAGHLSHGLVGFVDTVIAGHHGTTTLAAVAVGTALFLVLFLRMTPCVATGPGGSHNALLGCTSEIQTAFLADSMDSGASPLTGGDLTLSPVLAVILWLGLFAAMAVATNTLRGREFLSVWRMFKERRPSGVEAPPTPEASPGA